MTFNVNNSSSQGWGKTSPQQFNSSHGKLGNSHLSRRSGYSNNQPFQRNTQGSIVLKYQEQQ